MKTMVRNTRQREAIRNIFLSMGRPLSIEEVHEAAAKEVQNLGIATVYRNVKSLVEDGFLIAVELPGEAPRYERAGKSHHHHFQCNECKRVYELEGCFQNWRSLLPQGFRMTAHELILYGSCAGCAGNLGGRERKSASAPGS